MNLLKCIGCRELRRKEIIVGGKPLVVYDCRRYFPYMCALSGLFRPGQIVEAVKDCPEQLDQHCILCEKTHLVTYGEPNCVWICAKHNHAWGKWLEAHPERNAYLSPKGRLKTANWVEVFREFVEEELKLR